MSSVGVVVPTSGLNFGFSIGDVISNAVAVIQSLGPYVVFPLAIMTTMGLLGIIFWVFRKVRTAGGGARA